MALRQDILERLIASKNNAAERAIAVALATSTPEEQSQLTDILLERNRRAGWVALIRAYDKLHEPVRQKVLARPRDLFGPLSETMQDAQGPARENVIAIVQACADARLVYLLAEALMDPRPPVRELAGKSFCDTVRRCCFRPPDASKESQEQPPLEPEDAVQIARAVDYAIGRFKTHRQLPALFAALMHERQQVSRLWAYFEDPYDDLTRAATVTLRAPNDPALITALFLALASPLKSAAMAGIAAMESPQLAAVAASQSFRLLDPLLRDSARGVTHLKILPAIRRDPPWTAANWHSWLQLIESVGLQPQEKLSWLQRLYEAAPAGVAGAGWKNCTLRAIAETLLPEAGTTLANALRDPDERVARCAARFLNNPRVVEWRGIAADMLPKSPHHSVRQMANSSYVPPDATPKKSTREPDRSASARSFNKAWNDYHKLPPAVQANTARSVASDPAFAVQLKEKLASKSVPELSQALKMLSALPSLSPYRNNIIALCGHPDPRIAAHAVRLVGRLEDPKLKDLLEAAMQHGDPRVRANAIESLEELHIVDRSQMVLTMLNSRHQRERANAIRAIGQFNFDTARECLTRMLADPNPLHRMAALWVVGQFNLFDVVRQVALMSRRDPNLRVRNRAVEMLETLSGNLPANH